MGFLGIFSNPNRDFRFELIKIERIPSCKIFHRELCGKRKRRTNKIRSGGERNREVIGITKKESE